MNGKTLGSNGWSIGKALGIVKVERPCFSCGDMLKTLWKSSRYGRRGQPSEREISRLEERGFGKDFLGIASPVRRQKQVLMTSILFSFWFGFFGRRISHEPVSMRAWSSPLMISFRFLSNQNQTTVSLMYKGFI